MFAAMRRHQTSSLLKSSLCACRDRRIVGACFGDRLDMSALDSRILRERRLGIALGEIVREKTARLVVPELRIMTAAPQQLRVRALFDDAALVEHDEPARYFTSRFASLTMSPMRLSSLRRNASSSARSPPTISRPISFSCSPNSGSFTA